MINMPNFVIKRSCRSDVRQRQRTTIITFTAIKSHKLSTRRWRSGHLGTYLRWLLSSRGTCKRSNVLDIYETKVSTLTSSIVPKDSLSRSERYRCRRPFSLWLLLLSGLGLAPSLTDWQVSADSEKEATEEEGKVKYWLIARGPKNLYSHFWKNLCRLILLRHIFIS